MDSFAALDALSALSQQPRLEAFRLLVRHEPEGLPAGEIAQALNVPANTLSTHLALLARAGLVTAERQSRTIRYRADLAGMQKLLSFLMQDCCQGEPEICSGLIGQIACKA